MIVGSCDAVGPLACLIAGSVAFGAAAFLAVAIFTALGRAREPHDRPGSPGHAVAQTFPIAERWRARSKGP